MSHTHHTYWHVFIGPLAAIYGRATTHMSKANAVGSQHSYYNKFNMLLMYCTYYSIYVKKTLQWTMLSLFWNFWLVVVFPLPPFLPTSLGFKANVVNLVSLHSPGLTPE